MSRTMKEREPADPPTPQELAQAAQAAMQAEAAQRAEVFHREYMELCQRHNCRHRPLTAMGFDGRVDWRLEAVALNSIAN